MRLVVGLGNPGERYRRTRHNVGFMVVDELAAAGGRAALARGGATPGWPRRGSAARTSLLVKPLTFMNRSGVRRWSACSRRTGGAAGRAWSVVDDVALELGTLRIRERGSHGGHNGLRSLIEIAGHRGVPAGAGGDPARASRRGTWRTTCSPTSRRRTCWSCRRWSAGGGRGRVPRSREGAAAAMNRFNGPRKA